MVSWVQVQALYRLGVATRLRWQSKAAGGSASVVRRDSVSAAECVLIALDAGCSVEQVLEVMASAREEVLSTQRSDVEVGDVSPGEDH